MLDNVGGLNGGLAALPDGWVVSTNLAARVTALAHAGPLRIESHVLRRGRNNVVTDIQIRDEGARDALVASGVLTSAILVPENGPPQWSRPLVLSGPPLDSGELPRIPEWLGVRPAGADAVEIDLGAELRNPWGILHGGVVATLVDLAAEHVTGGWTTDVVLHFLAPNRVGPVRAYAAGARTPQRRHRLAGRGARRRRRAHDRPRRRDLGRARLKHGDWSSPRENRADRKSAGRMR